MTPGMKPMGKKGKKEKGSPDSFPVKVNVQDDFRRLAEAERKGGRFRSVGKEGKDSRSKILAK